MIDLPKEKLSVRVKGKSSNSLEVLQLSYKETALQVLYCEYPKGSRNNFFIEQHWWMLLK